MGKKEAVIVDTWWQTENGGFLCSTKPALDPMKPGSAGPGVPGIHPVIYDEEGKEVPRGTKAGNICIRNPWPGIMQKQQPPRGAIVKCSAIPRMVAHQPPSKARAPMSPLAMY